MLSLKQLRPSRISSFSAKAWRASPFKLTGSLNRSFNKTASYNEVSSKQVAASKQWSRRELTTIKERKLINEEQLIAQYLAYFMADEDSFDNCGPCLPKPALQVPLTERQSCVAKIKGVFDQRTQAFEAGNNGRLKIPVAVGIPGMGKTRLLDEYRQYFGIAERVFPLFVVYKHGHSITQADCDLHIQVTFSARLLHRFFFEKGPTKVSFETFMKSLAIQPNTMDQLTISRACRVVRKGLEAAGKIKEDDVLRLFIGIDEYQAIPDGGGDTRKSKLCQLIALLVDASTQLLDHKIHIYPLFAGTEWGRISDFGSSNTFLSKVSLPFLSFQGSLKISQSVFDNGITNKPFVDGVAELGGSPRLTLGYAEAAKEKPMMRPSELANLRRDVFNLYFGSCFSNLNEDEVILLVAYGICRRSIQPSGKPMPGGILDMTWQQLANRGFLQLEDDRYVSIWISYALMVYCSELSANDEKSVKYFFLMALKEIVRLSSTNDWVDPWQRWKHFGALYHAARINAFLITGATVATLSELLGFMRSPNDHLSIPVRLRPAEVFLSNETLSRTTDLECLTDKVNSSRKKSAFDASTCYIFSNGTAGEGAADIFFAFHCIDERRVLVLDQRKLDKNRLRTPYVLGKQQQPTAEGILSSVAPTQLNADVVIVPVLFSAIKSSFGKRDFELPSDCVAMSLDTLKLYHGPFANCAAAFTRTNLNTANLTTIIQLLNCSRETAIALMMRSKSHPFLFFDDLREFLQQHNTSLSANTRQWLLLIDDDEDEEDGGADDTTNDITSDTTNDITNDITYDITNDTTNDATNDTSTA